MSFNFLNGYGNPAVFIRYRSDGTLREYIELDMCMIEAGQSESYDENYDSVELEKDSRIIDYNFKGSRITFDLDYSSVSNADNTMKLERISYYNSLPEQYYIVLLPRTIGAGTRFFEVRYRQQLTMSRHQKGKDAIGDKGVKARFVTTIPQSKNFVITDDSAYAVPFHVV